MTIVLTDKEKEILLLASPGCCCESYYHYQCLLCQAIGKGLLRTHTSEIKRLQSWGFITVGSYSYLNITKQGRELL